MARRCVLWAAMLVAGFHFHIAGARAERLSTGADGLQELTALCGRDQGPVAERIADCTAAIIMERRPAQRARLLTDRGWHKRADGKMSEALKDFESALALAPASDGARRGKGVALSDLRRFGEAEALFTEMLRRHDTHPGLYVDRGVVYVRSGQEDKALLDYSAAIALAPSWTAARMRRGRLALDRKDYDTAKADFDAGIAAEPGNVAFRHWRAVASSGKGDYREAVLLFNAALAVDGKGVGTWLERGRALERLERYDAALRSYERGLKLAPGHDGLLFRKAYALSILKRYDEAIRAYEAAIKADPKDAASYRNMAILLGSQQKTDEAFKAIETALRLDPKFAEAYHTRGALHFDRDAYQRALRDLTRSIELGYTNVSLFNLRGRTLLRLKRHREAAADFDRVIRMDGSRLYGHHNRGLAAERQGQWEEALRFFSQALAINPEETDTRDKRDAMLAKLGRDGEMWRLRLTEAGQALRRAVLATLAKKEQAAPVREPEMARLDRELELDPYDDASRLRRARLLADAAGTRARALSDIEWLLRETPDHLDALRERASLHYDAKRHAEAISDAERVLAAAPGDFDGLFVRARTRAALAQDDAAIDDYTAVIALHPRSKAARFNRGLLYSRARRFVEAEADFSEAIRLRPDMDDSWRNRGLVRREQARYAEARADISEALRLAPNHGGNIAEFGRVINDEGDTPAAIAYLTAAIERGVTAPVVWNNRCYYRVLMREFEAARSDCAETLRLDPDYWPSFHSLGVMKVHEGDIDAALTLFDRAIAGNARNAFAHMGRAIALGRQGRAELAQAALETARGLDPKIETRYRETGLSP